MSDKVKYINERLSALAVELESTTDAVCHAGMDDETFELACQGMQRMRRELEGVRDILLMGSTATSDAEHQLY